MQKKLAIGSANDPAEKEAEEMAEKVVRMSLQKASFESMKNQLHSSVQRKCVKCEEEDQKIQKQNEDRTSAVLEVPSIVYDVINSNGQPLEAETKSFMEARFGYDFGKVKIHTDSLAAKSAQAVNALAYTSGNNIVFNQGQYSPQSYNGKKLIAHELTHVLQQNKQDGTLQALRANSLTKASDDGNTIQTIHRQDTEPDNFTGASKSAGIGGCRGWNDPKDLAIEAAKHYLLTQYSLDLEVLNVTCAGDINIGSCDVTFSSQNLLNSIVVSVFLGAIVSVQRTDLRGPTCDYTYKCIGKGKPTFTQVSCVSVPAPRFDKLNLSQISSPTGKVNRSSNLVLERKLSPSTIAPREAPGLEKSTEDDVIYFFKKNYKQGAIELILRDLESKKKIKRKLLDGDTMHFDPTLTGDEGLTDIPFRYKKGTPLYVHIGPSAFTDISQLYDTILHEYQHVLDAQTGKGLFIEVRHLEIYANSIIVNASATGIDKKPSLMKDIWERTHENWLDIKTVWNKVSAKKQKELSKLYSDAHTVAAKVVGPSVVLDFMP